VSGCYSCYGCYGAAPARPAAGGGGGGGGAGGGGGGGGARVDPSLMPRNEAEADAVRDALKKLRKKRQQRRDDDEASSDTLVSTTQRAAQITVRLPADARLYVDNVFCPLTSSTRSFPTPPLQPGRDFYYTLRAEVTRNGETLVRSQRVTVGAGRQVNVEFNDFESVRTAQR